MKLLQYFTFLFIHFTYNLPVLHCNIIQNSVAFMLPSIINDLK